MTTLQSGGPAFVVDLVILQGAHNDFWFRYGAEEDPVDLTGWTGRSQVRTAVGGTVMAEFTVTLGDETGTVELSLTPEQTEAWPDTFKKGVYDCELIAGDGTVSRFLQGAVKVSPDVTREETE